MPTCPKCHADLAPGSRFCPSCGTALSSSAHCPSCGAEITPGAVFCTSCGARVSNAPQAPQPTPSAAPGVTPGIVLGESIPAMSQAHQTSRPPQASRNTGVVLGENIPAVPQTPVQPFQPRPVQTQSQTQYTTVPVGDASVTADTYAGLNALKIVFWVLAVLAMVFNSYSILSKFVYDNGWWCKDVLDIFGSWPSVGIYQEKVTLGLVVSLSLFVVFLILAIVVGNIRRNKIRRQQQGI